MEFLNSKKFIFIILLVLLVAVLSGCANKNLPQQGPKQPTTLDSVAKMKSIGALLGCMFAPNDPECDRFKSRKTDEKPHKSQEEYDAENNKEWDEMETDTKPVAQE